jgi:hypothetical protein
MYCCNPPNPNSNLMKVPTKLMKIVLFCTRFKLNETIGNTKVKVDTKLKNISTKMCSEYDNLAIADSKAKFRC